MLGREIDTAAALAWIEDNSKLHQSVRVLYVVDGYEVLLVNDDEDRIAGPWHGETLYDAIVAAQP